MRALARNGGLPASKPVLMRLNSHNVASYLSVIAHALTTLKSLSEHESRYVCYFELSRTKIRQALRPRVSLVLMDSKLDSLSLPVLRPSIHTPEVELGGQSDPLYHVGFLVDRYFEWVGTFESSMSTLRACDGFHVLIQRRGHLPLTNGTADTHPAFKRNSPR